jgi:membrane protein required for colicin V production
MMAGWNWLDYALVAIIALGVLHGLSRGALRMVTSILSLVLAFYAASMWHEQAGALARAHLGTTPEVSDTFGYVVVFLLVVVAVGMAGGRLIQLVQLVHLGLLDRLAGAFVGGALAIVLAGLGIVLLTAVMPPNYPPLQNSRLAPQVLAYDQKLVACVPPELKRMYGEKRDRLVRYWDSRDDKTATAPDAGR